MFKTSFVVLLAATFVIAAPSAKESPTHGCKDTVAGSACNPYDVNCDQCDWCLLDNNVVRSNFARCEAVIPPNPFLPATGVWVIEVCEHNYLVDRTKKLASGMNGGQCTHWNNLDASEQQRYLNDEPDCVVDRNICKYWQDQACSPDYWFQMNSSAAPEKGQCNNGDYWNPATENCSSCDKVQGCTCWWVEMFRELKLQKVYLYPNQLN